MLGSASLIDATDVSDELSSHLHRHTAEIRHQMSAIDMAGQATFCTLSGLLPAERYNLTTMAAPAWGQGSDWLESMRNTVVDLLLIRIRLSVALANTFGDHTRVTFGVAGVLAILALHAG